MLKRLDKNKLHPSCIHTRRKHLNQGYWNSSFLTSACKALSRRGGGGGGGGTSALDSFAAKFTCFISHIMTKQVYLLQTGNLLWVVFSKFIWSAECFKTKNNSPDACEYSDYKIQVCSFLPSLVGTCGSLEVSLEATEDFLCCKGILSFIFFLFDGTSGTLGFIFISTGRVRLIRSPSPARFSFKLSGSLD